MLSRGLARRNPQLLVLPYEIPLLEVKSFIWINDPVIANVGLPPIGNRRRDSDIVETQMNR